METTAIREALELRGWSQDRVGDLLGIQQSAVSKRIRGERTWPEADIARLAEALEVGVDDLTADRLPPEVRVRLAVARANEGVTA